MNEMNVKEAAEKWGREHKITVTADQRIKELEAEVAKKDKALKYAIRFLDPKQCDRYFVVKALRGE